MKKISVSEYAELLNLSVKTIYKKINRGEIPHVVEGGKKYITVEDTAYFDYLEKKGESGKERSTITGDSTATSFVQEAELIDDSPGEKKYNLVTMENNTFEHLILNITELSEKRAVTYEETIKRLQNEYYETRSENKGLNEELKKTSIALAEADVNFRICEIRVKELESNQGKKREQILSLEKELLKTRQEIELLMNNNRLITEELKQSSKVIEELKQKNELVEKELKEVLSSANKENRSFWSGKL